VAQLACPNCKRLLQFDTRSCSGCHSAVGFDPGVDRFLFLAPATAAWSSAPFRGTAAVACDNTRYGVCNWLVTDGHPSGHCISCRHNLIIPDLTVPGVLQRWRKLEDSKRRAIWGVLRFGLSLDGWPPLGFHLLYDAKAEAGGPPQHPTGYLEGVVTLNLVEADDSARERVRASMAEPYRTLVGHFRHEFGHHYWHRLVAASPHLEAFRRLFGDERADYAAAAQAYYARPATAEWKPSFVSRYASMHPWEDFSETFAHLLHIADTLSSIGDFGMTLLDWPDAEAPPSLANVDPYRADTATLARIWPPYAFALNAVTRSMGQPALYPFSLTPTVALKLDFINRLIADATGRAPMSDGEQEGLKAVMAVLALSADPGDETSPI
jgi:hypothetical protein